MNTAQNMQAESSVTTGNGHGLRDSLTLLVAGFAIFNFVALPLLSMFPPGLFIIFPGVVAAEVGFVAAWGVYGPNSFFKRFLQCLVVGVILYGAFSLSLLGISNRDPEVPELLLVGLFVCPTFFLAIQMPLWLLSVWYRGVNRNGAIASEAQDDREDHELSKTDAELTETHERSDEPDRHHEDLLLCSTNERLELRDYDACPESNMVFKIRDLMIGTTLVAAAFASARLGALSISVEDSREDLLHAIIIMAACLIPWSLFCLVPLLWLGLAVISTTYRRLGFLLWLAMCTVPGTISMAFLTPDRTLIILYLLGVGAYVLVIWTVLLVARRWGLRLVAKSPRP